MNFEDLIAWLDRPVATGRGRTFRLNQDKSDETHPVRCIALFETGTVSIALSRTLRSLRIKVRDPLFVAGEGLVRSPGSDCLSHPPAVVGWFQATPTTLEIDCMRSAFGVRTLQIEGLVPEGLGFGPDRDASGVVATALEAATVEFTEFPPEAHPYYVPELNFGRD